MKLSVLLFLMSFQFALAQTEDDSLQYVLFKDEFGVKRKAPVVFADQILVVKGDSIFFIPDELKLRNYINKNQSYDVIHNKDSVRIFLQKRVKALIVIKDKKKD